MKPRLVSVAATFAGFAALIAVLLLINPNLFVTPGTNLLIDPWIYTGFFLTLPSQLELFPGTYYGSRLSWLLPGHAVHQALSPLMAAYVLHLGSFALLLFATFRLVQRAVNPAAAWTTAALMAWNPLVLAAMSSDYVDGIGMAVIVAMLWCLDEAVRSARAPWAWALAAGMGFGCLIAFNLFLVVLGPVFLLFVFLRSGPSRWRLHLMIAGTTVLAVAAVFGVLGYANVGLGGGWWFLAPQTNEARTLVAAPNPWQWPGYSWLAYATWLVLPTLGVVGAIVSSLRSKWRLPFDLALTMQLVLLAAAATWIAIQAWSTPVLQLSYYSSYLSPIAILALVLAASSLDEGRQTRAVVLVGVACAAGAVVHLVVLSNPAGFWDAASRGWSDRLLSPVDSIAIEHRASVVATAVCLLVGLAGIAVLHVAGSARAGVPVLVACLALSFAAPPVFWPAAGDPNTKPRYVATAEAHRYISATSAGRKPRLWYRLRPDEARPFKSVASTFLWGYVLVNEELPLITDAQAQSLAPAARLVLLVPRLTDAGAAREPLRQYGLDFTLVDHQEFGEGATAFSVVVTDLVALARR